MQDTTYGAGSAPYVRGTKTHRMTTARLAAGMRVLTNGAAVQTEVSTYVNPAATKTGAVVRTVAKLSAVMVTVNSFHRSQQRRYSVLFTDGAIVANLAPVQSWHAVTETPAAEAGN